MNQTSSSAVEGSASQSESMTAQEQYEMYFVPHQTAIKRGQEQAAFEIYSAVDYSIPVTFSSSSVVEDQRADA